VRELARDIDYSFGICWRSRLRRDLPLFINSIELSFDADLFLSLSLFSLANSDEFQMSRKVSCRG